MTPRPVPELHFREYQLLKELLILMADLTTAVSDLTTAVAATQTLVAAKNAEIANLQSQLAAAGQPEADAIEVQVANLTALS